MSTVQENRTTVASTTTERRPVWRHGITATAVAAVVVTALAAIAKAGGVSFDDSSGASIPLAGFAELTAFFSLVGTGIAALTARKARRPRSTFVRTAVVLTVLSYVPDAVSGFSTGSAVTLMALHTIAAVIVVPVLARRLAR